MLIFDRFSDEKTPYDGCHTGLNAAYSLFSSSSLRFLLIIASGVPAPAAPATMRERRTISAELWKATAVSP